MSDPRETPNPPPPPPAGTPPPSGSEPPVVEERRKGVHPLVWILVLLALAALAWWFYHRSVDTGLDTTAPVTGAEPAVTSEQEQAATAERERAQANERRQAERQRERQRAAARDTAVEPIQRVQPTYPPAAYRAREEGTVLLRVQVDATGNPTEVSVARRSGSRDLDRAAQQAVRKWKFRPATKGGKAVASVAQVPVDFRMDR